MGYEVLLKAYAKESTRFWLRAIDRYKVARQEIENDTYTADDLARDVGKLWIDAGDAVANLLPSGGGPVLPTVAITAQQPIPGPLKGTAFAPIEIPSSATLSSTPLALIGGPDTIAANTVTATLVDGELEITIDLTASGVLTAGVYQGVTYANGSPVAFVLLHVS